MNTTIQKEIKIDANKVMDARAVPCSVKHGFIVQTFQKLAVGDYFILLNDHDPARLREQFTAQWPETFTWEYLELGPDNFRVKITKVKSLPTSAVPVARDCNH